MTQETVEQPKHNPQKYRQISTVRFKNYAEARISAVKAFSELTGELFKLAPTELTAPSHKVRVKRRQDAGREFFDVVSYASIEAKKAEEVQTAPAEVTAVVTEEKPREKAKDRRAREQKKS